MQAFFTAIILALIAMPSYALESSAPVKTTLISDSQKISPGKPFTVFVDFALQPDWHIYYKNAGQMGLPTKIEWELPPTLSAQPMIWPKPETFKDSGYEMFGYSKNTRLTMQILPAKTLKKGQIVTIKASANWLACKQSCTPGKSAMTMNLKVE